MEAWPLLLLLPPKRTDIGKVVNVVPVADHELGLPLLGVGNKGRDHERVVLAKDPRWPEGHRGKLGTVGLQDHDLCILLGLRVVVEIAGGVGPRLVDVDEVGAVEHDRCAARKDQLRDPLLLARCYHVPAWGIIAAAGERARTRT